MHTENEFAAGDPTPNSDAERVTLADGGGGTRMHQLLESIVFPTFDNPVLATRHDGAVLPVGGARLAFTTDSLSLIHI